jgi:prepilin-type N-terminal cleavage/methylation domain-containing protein
MRRTFPTSSRSAFTLVELLVVIAIIVILMSLLLAGMRMAKRATRKTEAHNTAHQIVAALNAYFTEYAKFPSIDDTSLPGTPPADTVVGDPAMGTHLPNNTIFFSLRSIPKGPNADYRVNPKKVVFYEGTAASVNAAGRARNGFYDRTSNGGVPQPAEDSCLYDPWGHQYGIILDGNGDDRIDLTGFYIDFSDTNPTSGRASRHKVGAFSMGEDETLGTSGNHFFRNGTEPSDDVVSWEK